MDEDIKYKIILRHDSSTNWTINNPIMAYGEYAVEDDTHRIKRGDGVTEWVALPYETFGVDITMQDLLDENYVRKEEGKGLSEEDYTYEDMVKLHSLQNYDDTAIKQTIHQYRIIVAATTEGYAKTYALEQDGIIVGSLIDIPKDLVVSSGEVKTVTTENVPYEGAQVGDKYIDLTLANADNGHIYIPVKDLVDVYTGSTSINVSNSNEISLIIDTNNANGLEIGENGLKLNEATPTVGQTQGTAGAMSAADKTKLDSLHQVTNTSELINDGDGVSAFATESYVATHGATFKPYPEGFDTTHTTQDFLTSIYDLSLDAGMCYLGGVRLTDMPFNGNAEIEVYIYPGNVIYLVLRSANISPYEWECNNHTYRGWEPIGKAYADTNFLNKTNTTAFTPTADYQPATKKYVDDAISTALSNIPDAEEVQY